MPIRRNRRHEMPMLNTSSLPDLIFTVLFFFMIVTHMRNTNVKVQYRTPQGTELTRLLKKSMVSYIYIGKPMGSKPNSATYANSNAPTLIQFNDRIVTLPEIANHIAAERAGMLPEDAQQLTVVIRADKDTKMKTIMEVKQALRRAKVANIYYAATASTNR